MPSDLRRVTRALLSVSDKTGLVPFAQALAQRGVELVSTGGTHAALVAAGLEVKRPVEGNLIQTFGGPRTYPTVSYYQALDADNSLPPDIFKDRIVIVGLSLQNAPTIESGGPDAFLTSSSLHTGKLVAGAEVQATIFDNLRLGQSIAEADGTIRQILLGVVCFLAIALVWRGTGWRTAAAAAAMVVTLCLGSYLGLRFGRMFISPVAPTLGFLAITAGQAALDYAEERRHRRRITRAFSQYLTPALVEQLARDPSKLKLGGEKRELSVLFCDVRGFTTIAEQLKDDPEQLTALINRLLTPLSDIVLAHGGTIDKYIGDCLMAFWNAPLDDPDHAVHAVAAALDMLGSMDALNAELKREAEDDGRIHHPLRIGVGVNTGECVVGNMGSTSRFDYSALGDPVNLAARLEGASKDYEVSLLIGERTAQAVGGAFVALELDRIVVKGKTQQSPVYTALRSCSEAAVRSHREFLCAYHAGDEARQMMLVGGLLNEIPDLAGYYRRMLGRRGAS